MAKVEVFRFWLQKLITAMPNTARSFASRVVEYLVTTKWYLTVKSYLLPKSGLNRICWWLNIPPQIKSNKGKHSISFRGHFTCIGNIAFIEEGLNKKTRQRSLRRIEGQNPCPTSCFASVFLKQTVETNRWVQPLPVELNRLSQKDQGFCPPFQCDNLCLVF